MGELKGYQRSHLKGLAHSLKPLIFIGKQGLTPAVVAAMNTALDMKELLKLKFVDAKEKEQKMELVAAIEKETGSEMVGMTGHVAAFYRRHKESEKRKIVVPQRQ